MKQKRTPADGFLTVDEAAQFVGLSHWTLRSWLQKGRLTKYKSGSRTLVSPAELLELLKPRRFAKGNHPVGDALAIDAVAPNPRTVRKQIKDT